MTAPMQPQQPDPREYLLYLRETGQTDLAAEFEAFLRDTGREFVIRNVDRQQEFESGRLGRRMQRENLNEAERVAAEQAMARQTEGLAGAGVRGLGAMASLARDIPGVEALQAGARSVVRGQPYGEALQDIRTAEGEVNPVSRGGLRFVGGGVAGAALPGSPAVSGATYGGLLNLLQADPNADLGNRAFTGAIGAGAGGALGKLSDVALTAGRALRAPNVDEGLAALENVRSEATAPLYAQAQREGAAAATTPMTPALRNVLDEPDIRGIVAELRTQRQFRGMDERDPRLLDAVYKALSDIERQLQSPLNAMNPTRVNTGRFDVQNVRAAKQQVLDAISRTPNAPMPTYAGAVEEYAAQSAPIEGFTRGHNMFGVAIGSRTNPATVRKQGPIGLADWLEGQSPEVVDAAVQGAEAYAKRRLGQSGVTGLLNPLRSTGRGVLFEGGNVLRQIEAMGAPTTRRTLRDFLQDAAVAGGTPAIGSR